MKKPWETCLTRALVIQRMELNSSQASLTWPNILEKSRDKEGSASDVTGVEFRKKINWIKRLERKKEAWTGFKVGAENCVSTNKGTVLCHRFLHVAMKVVYFVWFGGGAVKSYIKSENLVCMDWFKRTQVWLEGLAFSQSIFLLK